jgi:hypothetical protein
MSRFPTQLFPRLPRRHRRPAPPQRNRLVRPRLETLEDRVVPAITDMTQMAQLFPPHPGPTHLYLNFDGWTNAEGNQGRTIYPYAGDETDIQNILFRTSEIFAPFDVEVSRAYGNGTYDAGNNGSTTVFIGGDTNNIDQNGKFTRGVTPNQYTDHATQSNSAHPPNSDPFDLAFVDPMAGPGTNPQGWYQSLVDPEIAQAIAHEAGHTFGLAHVLSQGVADEMSYDSTNRYFANQTFNITDLNGTGSTPSHHPYWGSDKILTQNSFTFLTAVLGSRPGDFDYHVAHSDSVDPSQYPGLIPLGANLSPGAHLTSSINRPGAYNVYRLDASQPMQLHLDVLPTGGQSLIPELLVYDGTGALATGGFVDSTWNGHNAYEVHADITLPVAGSCYFVVGPVGGNSTGTYTLNVLRTDGLQVIQNGVSWGDLSGLLGLASAHLGAVVSPSVGTRPPELVVRTPPGAPGPVPLNGTAADRLAFRGFTGRTAASRHDPAAPLAGGLLFSLDFLAAVRLGQLS